jgi:hypothetical protein
MSSLVGDGFFRQSRKTSRMLLRIFLRLDEGSLLGLNDSGTGCFALGTGRVLVLVVGFVWCGGLTSWAHLLWRAFLLRLEP